jgi:hypothetical protein
MLGVVVCWGWGFDVLGSGPLPRLLGPPVGASLPTIIPARFGCSHIARPALP